MDSERAPRESWRWWNHERAVLISAFAVALPGIFAAFVLLWVGQHPGKVTVAVVGTLLVASALLATAVRRRVESPLQALSNMVWALRDGDYSVRARIRSHGDALEAVLLEVNSLADTLREQRLAAIEATELLRKVMEEIDVAVFAFDHEARLRLVNRAGEGLLAEPSERLLGRTSEQLNLAVCLEGERSQIIEKDFPGGTGRWRSRSGTFRQQGLTHRLLVLTDISKALRDEERQAWQRLLRVLGHELNNSLSPIKSMASTLGGLMARERRPADWEEDTRSGLAVIASRAEALTRFMQAYTRLARLPAPQLTSIDFGSLLRRVVSLEGRLATTVIPGPEVTILADGDQLEQLLINLLRNAADAALETGGGIRVSWTVTKSWLDISIEDEGPGLANQQNLFVPFFTTKPGGSGIGLVLSRQIAEAHGGSLSLENRPDGAGCRARIRLRTRVLQSEMHG